MSVDTREPKDPDLYASFEQDGLRIYYSRRLGRKAETLELDYLRLLFRSRPVVTGPDDLLAKIVLGRL